MNPSIVSDWNQWSVRIDHNISERDSTFYRYIWVEEPLFQPSIPEVGPTYPSKGGTLRRDGLALSAPQLVNTLHAGMEQGGLAANGGVRRRVGKLSAASRVEEHFRQSSGLAASRGKPCRLQRVGRTGFRSWEYRRKYTVQQYPHYRRGNHSLRFGGEYRHIRYFDCRTRGQPAATFAGNYTGSPIGDYLLGIPSRRPVFRGRAPDCARTSTPFMLPIPGKVRPNFTLTIGTGWEYKSPIVEIENRMAIFDFPQLRLLIWGKDFPARPGRSFYGGYKPQLGFAWRPFGSGTVILRVRDLLGIAEVERLT